MRHDNALVLSLLALLPTARSQASFDIHARQAANGTENGPCVGANGVPGVCVSTKSCTDIGGSFISNACPEAGDDIKCCTKTTCGDAGTGSCGFKSSCTGTTRTGLCPGSTDFLCCIGNNGTAPGNATNTTTCATGLHLIVARGSDEPPGGGKMGGTVATNVTARIANSTIQGLDWPATFENYFNSEGAGTIALRGTLDRYQKSCPNTKIALLGYSQGGQVIADTLCGNSEGDFFAESLPVSETLTKNVVAVVIFGDPSHVTGVSWNAGSSKKNGIFPRQNTSACDPYANRMRSWCDTGDRYCDSGNDTSVHRGYFGNYTVDATNFIVSKYNESMGLGSGGGGPSTTTTTGAPTGAGGTPTTSPPPSTTAGNAAFRLNIGALGYALMTVAALAMLC